MSNRLLKMGACIAMAVALAACGGDDGAQGLQGPKGDPGNQGPPGPAAPQAIFLTANTPADTFAALDMAATVTSVTVNPASAATNPGTVVNFKIADRITGAAIVGYGRKAKCFARNSATASYGDCYPNLAFTLAKLVPGAGGSPSKWVNYVVTTAPATASHSGCATPNVACLSAPSTDNTGTLVDNGDGTYKYTFARDIAGMAAQVAAITPPAGFVKGDLDDVSFNASATHRLVIQMSGSAPGTGSNNATGLSTGFPAAVALKKPLDVIFDFVPATGQAPAASANRKMVANANCQSCHSTLGGLPGGDGGSLEFHSGGRNNIEYCVICHTEQRKFGQAEATYNATTRAFTGGTNKVDGQAIGNVLSFLHKIHVAGVMTRTGYDYAGVQFDKGGYSQDIRNCDKCHDSTGASTGGTALPQAALWKTEANRKACSSCHDGINFDTGLGLTLADKAANLSVSTGFNGQAHPSNSTDGTCLNSSCHAAGGPGDPDLFHKPIVPPNKQSALHVAGGTSQANAAWIASNPARLPAGAIKVAYDIKEVRLNGTRNPQMVFRMLQNSTAVALNDPTSSAAVNAKTGRPEIWPNFMGSPSVYFVWSVPQDGVTTPQDFNASANGYLRSLWQANGAVGGSNAGAGTLVAGTGAEAGYYVATLTAVTVPTTARMLTGGMGFSYSVTSTLPLTQTDLAAYPVPQLGYESRYIAPGTGASPAPNPTGGLIVIAPNATKVATGFTGRRVITDDKRCNDCHQELGVFTEDSFHAGQRNDGANCGWAGGCHGPNRTSSAWSADSTAFVHAIHGGGKRTVPYTWHAVSTTETFADIKYPGVLARCTQCHIAGSYDFANSASANAAGLGTDQIDKRLPRTVGVGKYIGTAGNAINAYTYNTGTGVCDVGALGTAQTALGVFSLSPYVTADANGTAGTYYGYPFNYNPTGTAIAASCSTNGTVIPAIPAGETLQASDETLVMSPTVAVCSACHDSDLAVSHMKLNGGTFYEPRSAWKTRTEQCFVCHASGRVAGITEMHAR